MRYGIFADVHANLEAFEAAVAYYKKQSIDKFIFLGDIVSYGANPRECINLLKNLKPAAIAGNHDWAVLDKLGMEYFNDYAQEALIWTKQELLLADRRYLDDFPLTYMEDNFTCVHGSLENPQEFNYILGIGDAFNNFSFLEKQLLFVGHSHRAQIFCKNNDGVFYVAATTVKLKSDEKYIVNPGSIGQPRDRDPRAGICIYDSSDKVVTLERLEYNIKASAAKILAKSLPAILAQRLYLGW
jgi:predicted phosphodiesterase